MWFLLFIVVAVFAEQLESSAFKTAIVDVSSAVTGKPTDWAGMSHTQLSIGSGTLITVGGGAMSKAFEM